MLTARLQDGSDACITALHDKTFPLWLSSSQIIPATETVKLREVDSRGAPIQPMKVQTKAEKGKGRDWLSLLLREALGMSLLRVFISCD